MTVESVTFISDLNPVNPAGTDQKKEGDNHIRNIKTGLGGSFPNFAGVAMTSTEAELNILDGVTSTTAELNILDGVTATTAELNYVDGVTSSIQTQINTTNSLLASLGKINGLVLSNDIDADHDINITSGSCPDSEKTSPLTLATEITKQIDSIWIAGDDAGGIFSGAVVADTWYHIFLIEKDSDESIDAGFDTSLTAANIPVGYTAYRRVGSVLTDGSANILAFTQKGDTFSFDVEQTNLSNASQSTSAITRSVSAPLGVNVSALLHIGFYDSSSTNIYIYASALSKSDEAATSSRSVLMAGSNTAFDTAQISILTNTSSQIRTRASSTNGHVNLLTYGWVDTRDD